MARQFVNSYTSDHVVLDDGTVEFACSQDIQKWPWLVLGPHHPITVQAQNFWTSVGAILALGAMEDGQWSALTWTQWTCHRPADGHAIRGHYSREVQSDNENYLVTLFDASDQAIVTMRGRGVVFRNRNFEEWRSKAKERAKATRPTELPDFASRDALGLGPLEHPLIGFDPEGADQSFLALISPENGLPPANPMLGGSGDHVNSVHMIEAARQALCLLTGSTNPVVSGGEMELNRYIELGTPFAMSVSDFSESEMMIDLSQLERRCARITLRYSDEQGTQP